MTRILIVRLGSLGDLVHALPAVAALRRAHPTAEIDWLVDAVHKAFLDLVPVISSIVTLEDRSAGGWLRVCRTLRARHYDAAIDFQGLLKSAALARLSGARRVLGFDRAALRESAASVFYKEAVAIGEGRHVIEKNLALAAALGADEVRPHEFPLRAVSSSALDEIRGTMPGRFALLNCGAAWPNKRWPAARFGRLARWLRDMSGMPSVILWGPGEESLGQAAAEASAGAAIAAPRTTLTDIVAISRAASLMVSGDTGPTHIAGAVGTPIVALFGPTNPHRNGPWHPDDIVISRYAACDCHYERQCSRDERAWCLGTISEDDVKSAITTRLGTSGAPA